ncbi:hypothetical protein B0I35DRAFT_159985 [Stachybotrys elegans]|uniref:Uncharacterized protein n=1 Tax=Stachybotrys elegans TaxID=80388 RepID=A0A8K0SV83_9HYPO|nr:hypothetical protein B0I35DRAFT_159985 [Stachybotrys elegans]
MDQTPERPRASRPQPLIVISPSPQKKTPIKIERDGDDWKILADIPEFRGQHNVPDTFNELTRIDLAGPALSPVFSMFMLSLGTIECDGRGTRRPAVRITATKAITRAEVMDLARDVLGKMLKLDHDQASLEAEVDAIFTKPRLHVLPAEARDKLYFWAAQHNKPELMSELRLVCGIKETSTETINLVQPFHPGNTGNPILDLAEGLKGVATAVEKDVGEVIMAEQSRLAAWAVWCQLGNAKTAVSLPTDGIRSRLQASALGTQSSSSADSSGTVIVKSDEVPGLHAPRPRSCVGPGIIQALQNASSDEPKTVKDDKMIEDAWKKMAMAVHYVDGTKAAQYGLQHTFKTLALNVTGRRGYEELMASIGGENGSKTRKEWDTVKEIWHNNLRFEFDELLVDI